MSEVVGPAEESTVVRERIRALSGSEQAGWPVEGEARYIGGVDEQLGNDASRSSQRQRRMREAGPPVDPGPLVEYDPLNYANLARSCVARL